MLYLQDSKLELAGWLVILLFILQVLNLFLALLLSSFGASNLSMARDPDDETNKVGVFIQTLYI